MVDTSRINSGFDVELMLGGQWFLTALNALNDNGLLDLPPGVSIVGVSVIMDADFDLEIDVVLLKVKAKMEIVGNNFSFTTDFNNTSFTIALPKFGCRWKIKTLRNIRAHSC